MPLGRMGGPDDVAQGYLFLASPAVGLRDRSQPGELHGGGEWPAFLTALEQAP